MLFKQLSGSWIRDCRGKEVTFDLLFKAHALGNSVAEAKIRNNIGKSSWFYGKEQRDKRDDLYFYFVS